MGQEKVVDTLKTSLLINIWAERNHIMLCFLTGILAIYAHLSLILFFEGLLGIFIFSGIVMLGFVAIVAHIKYYFNFEKNRKVELYSDRLVIIVDDKITDQIFKKDIIKITLFDKIRSTGKAWPTFVDPFYYLNVISIGQEKLILTCLLDMKLKKKIAAWCGQELEHKYQFFPLPPSS